MKLIPWGANLEELSEIAVPKISSSKNCTSIWWYDHICLSGMECSISTEFYNPTEFDSEYPRANPDKLGKVDLHFAIREDETVSSHHLRTKESLLSLFGEPTKDEIDEMLRLPFVEWDLDHVLIAHFIFDRFGQYLVTEIWQKPLPKWRDKK